MAVFKPSLDQLGQFLEPLNDGEHRIARELARQLDDGWTIYVQPRLSMDVPDFVAVHDHYGVCAIEVKDWAYDRYRIGVNGMVQRRTSTGWIPTEQHPRYQAYRYRSTIFEQFFALPEDGKAITPAVRSIVLLLNHTTAHARRTLVTTDAAKTMATVDVYGDDALSKLASIVVGACPSRPNPASIARLRRYLAQSEVMLELQQPLRLSDGAKNIETNPNNARVRRVRGPAGCGKSFGLAARAARLAADRKSVLVLTYNVTLAHYLQSLVASHAKTYAAQPRLVTCVHFHGFCARVAEDAVSNGLTLDVPTGVAWFNRGVARADCALAQGFGPKFDAILIDEGQDFTLEWWNMLRNHVLAPDGEMLLVADPTQDLYSQKAWTDEDKMLGAGFSGPWTDLNGSYRMPWDMVRVADEFCRTMIRGEVIAPTVPTDQGSINGRSTRTHRDWINVDDPGTLGRAVGAATVRLLAEHPDLEPADVVFLCETHEQGLDAVEVIEAAGHPMSHIFASSNDEQRRRKARFWTDAPGIKGCTVASFKGWESRVVVMGIGDGIQSRRHAYVAMTRLKGDPSGRSSHVVVANADAGLRAFGQFFEAPAEGWPAPLAEARVG